jgi:hypothetical protein
MKILKYILIMILPLLLFTCEESTMPLFDAQYSFVSITDGSYSISKSSTKILQIPVVIAGIPGSDVSVTFKVEETGDNPAKEGVDYEVVNVDKKVVVGGGAGTGYVQIKPLDSKDAIGNKTFKVKLVSNSANLYIAVDADSVIAKIADSNNPLAFLVGSYEQNDYVLDTTAVEGPWKVTIDIDSGSDNMLTITNFWDGGEVLKAKFDVATNTIQILVGQTVYVSSDYGNVKAVAINLDKQEYDETAPINGVWKEDGTITLGAWAALVPEGSFGNYEKTILTKK